MRQDKTFLFVILKI